MNSSFATPFLYFTAIVFNSFIIMFDNISQTLPPRCVLLLE